MKRYIYILLSIPFLSFVQTEKEIPSKIYYRDEKYVNITWDINFDNEIYPDTAIFIIPNIDIFKFKGDTKNINIYFDKQFKILAVLMKLDKKDKTLHYKKYDRKGDLRMEYFQKNNKYEGFHKAWFSNGNLKFKQYYEKEQHISDTSYYVTGKIESSVSYFYSTPFNMKNYYQNGKVAIENFKRIPKKEEGDNQYTSELYNGFVICYDSLTGFPNLYHDFYTDEVSYSEDGAEYTVRFSRTLHIDSAKINKKK